MMLGFKRRFAPFVKDGSKRHTIRDRKPPKVGETLHCYVDPRQKTMALLGRWPCVRVEDFFVRIGEPSRLTIDGVILTPDEANLFAWNDGFRGSGPEGSWLEMQCYWAKEHPCRQMFTGYIIHWDYEHPSRGTSPVPPSSRAISLDCPNPKKTEVPSS